LIRATYRTPDGASASVAPPFGMAPGYNAQRAAASQPKHQQHVQNVLKKRGITSIIGRVQAARGSPEEIRAVTQALIDDKALDDVAAVDDDIGPLSLEQHIRKLMFEYMIGIDCAAYVQQAFLFARGIRRRATKLDPNILNENLMNLAQKGFARFVDPAMAESGDIGVLNRPAWEHVGHTVIVYSRREANAADKAALSQKPYAPGSWQPADFLNVSGPIHILQVDSSWGSSGKPEHGGIQRRTWWYSPLGRPKWAWQMDPTMGDDVYLGEQPYDHPLQGFYRMKAQP